MESCVVFAISTVALVAGFSSAIRGTFKTPTSKLSIIHKSLPNLFIKSTSSRIHLQQSSKIQRITSSNYHKIIVPHMQKDAELLQSLAAQSTLFRNSNDWDDDDDDFYEHDIDPNERVHNVFLAFKALAYASLLCSTLGVMIVSGVMCVFEINSVETKQI